MEGAYHGNANFYGGLNKNPPCNGCVWETCSRERGKLMGKPAKRSCRDPGRKQHGCERVAMWGLPSAGTGMVAGTTTGVAVDVTITCGTQERNWRGATTTQAREAVEKGGNCG